MGHPYFHRTAEEVSGPISFLVTVTGQFVGGASLIIAIILDNIIVSLVLRGDLDYHLMHVNGNALIAQRSLCLSIGKPLTSHDEESFV